MKTNRIITNLLIVFYSLVLISGLLLVVLKLGLTNSIMNFSSWEWGFIHRIVALIATLLTIQHIYKHRKWYKVLFKKKVITINLTTYLLSIVYLISVVVLLILAFNLQNKLLEIIHSVLGLVLTYYLYLHTMKKYKDKHKKRVMENKGNEFKGIVGGANYKRFGKFFGCTEIFYQSCVSNLSYQKPIKALDLGCGPGAICFLLDNILPKESTIIGVDISNDQLNFARKYSQNSINKMHFLKCSMDEINFPESEFDLVISSMAFHEVPRKVRYATIEKVSKTLRRGGHFILIDWSKPKFGKLSFIWYPMLVFTRNKDNWDNTYKNIIESKGFVQTGDEYLTSVFRRQIFIKE